MDLRMQARELAQIDHWSSIEAHGVILVWYHAEESQPLWTPPALDGFDPSWKYQGRNEFLINCHVQDISENAADQAHFNALHSQAIFCGGEPSSWFSWVTDWALHQWTLQWRPLPSPQGHRATLDLHHRLRVMGKYNLFELKVRELTCPRHC